jgi:hypothetical protein
MVERMVVPLVDLTVATLAVNWADNSAVRMVDQMVLKMVEQ